MPISVTCGSCSAAFTVKDEYAGKRAKCPKCGEPFTVPAAAVLPPPAAPVVAKPVMAKPVAATPVSPKREREADDEDDAPVSPKRKRGAGDEGDDEKPRSRRRADDADDDKPRSRRRRRDDDDDAPKKKSALPIILGILGAVVLVCGGGCAGVWLFIVNPAIDQAKAKVSERQEELDRIERARNQSPPTEPAETVTEENLRKVRTGMTADQVQAILGSGLRATRSELPAAVAKQPDPADATARWTPRVDGGFALAYMGRPSAVVLVLYSPGPYDGGTVVAAIGSFGDRGIEPIRLPGEAKVPPPSEAPVTLTAEQLSDRAGELKDKAVVVTGKVEFVSNATQGGSITLARSRGKKSVGMAFTAAKWNAEWAGKKMQPGDGVTIKGVVGVDPTGVRVLVKDCELVSHTPGGHKAEDRTPVATLTPEELAVNHAQMKDKWVTLKGEYKSNTSGEGSSVVLTAPTGKTMIVQPPGTSKFAFKTAPQPLDQIEFVGKVSGSDRLMILTDATLVSQSPNTEKPTELTADDLIAEFEKDADAATKKYQGKLIKVSGQVSSGGSTGSHLGVRGTQAKPPGGKGKAYFVDCLFEGAARDAAKRVKPTDKVAIVGRFSELKKGGGDTYTITLTTSRLDK